MVTSDPLRESRGHVTATIDSEPEAPAGTRIAVRAIAFVVGARASGPRSPPPGCWRRTSGRRRSSGRTRSRRSAGPVVGYAVGRRLADRRRPGGRCAGSFVRLGCCWRWFRSSADPFLRLRSTRSERFGGRVPRVAGGGAGAGRGPLLLLGAVAPFAEPARVRPRQPSRIGQRTPVRDLDAGVAGRTFLAALLLIPWVGTHRTFLVFALSLAVVASRGAPVGRSGSSRSRLRRCWRCRRGGRGRCGARRAGDLRGRHRVPVRAGRAVRRRPLAGAERGRGDPLPLPARHYLTGGYWDDFLVLPFAPAPPGAPGRSRSSATPPARSPAPTATSFPHTRVDAVELDGELTAIGRRYFDLRGPRLHTYTADARPWLAASTPTTTRSSSTPTASPTSRSTCHPRVLRARARSPEPRRDVHRQRRAPAGLIRPGERRLRHGTAELQLRHSRSGEHGRHLLVACSRPSSGR